MRIDPLRTLEEIDDAEIMRVAHQLNATGFATDEDGLCLSAELVEHWAFCCTDLLRLHGYDGGPLRALGQYFPRRGAIYLLYDSQRHTHDEARAQLKRAGRWARALSASAFPVARIEEARAGCRGALGIGPGDYPWGLCAISSQY